MDQLIHLIVESAGLLWVYSSAWFILSVLLKRNDIADIAWGLGYAFLCGWLYITLSTSPVAILIYIVVWIWAIRLSVHIYLRNRGKQEDFRYRQWREEWGKNFYWRSYLQVYLLQAFILLIISSPLILAAVAEARLSVFTLVGLGIWVIGFFFQSVGDYQLSVFVKTKKPGEIIQQGLWRYTRHPNYFGEIMMWWGIFFMVFPLPYGYWFVISPLTITFLLVFVSGVPMLEKKYAGNPAFQEYKKHTPAIIPKFR